MNTWTALFTIVMVVAALKVLRRHYPGSIIVDLIEDGVIIVCWIAGVALLVLAYV